MKNTALALRISLIVLLLALLGILFYLFMVRQAVDTLPDMPRTPTTTNNGTVTTTPDALLRVDSPKPGQAVRSPLVVTGQARGNWYFEASFPVKLVDANGKQLVQVPATAQGEWMTQDFVPFSATLTFAVPETATGTLILEKDNPSGLPQFDDERRIPVTFERNLQVIKLYYYNPEKDKDQQGNILCSTKGLIEVQRTIPLTQTPIQDAVRLLLQGSLTEQEKQMGITTEFPLPGVSLKGAALSDGILKLEFLDPQNRLSGGACRVSVLRHQVEATVKQFSGVRTVEFLPEDLFQP